MSGYTHDPDAPGITATDDEAQAMRSGLTYWDDDAGQYRRPNKDAGESENAPWLTQTRQDSGRARDDEHLFGQPNAADGPIPGDVHGATVNADVEREKAERYAELGASEADDAAHSPQADRPQDAANPVHEPNDRPGGESSVRSDAEGDPAELDSNAEQADTEDDDKAGKPAASRTSRKSK